MPTSRQRTPKAHFCSGPKSTRWARRSWSCSISLKLTYPALLSTDSSAPMGFFTFWFSVSSLESVRLSSQDLFSARRALDLRLFFCCCWGDRARLSRLCLDPPRLLSFYKNFFNKSNGRCKWKARFPLTQYWRKKRECGTHRVRHSVLFEAIDVCAINFSDTSVTVD